MWKRLSIEESRIDPRVLHPVHSQTHHGKVSEREDKDSDSGMDAPRKRNQDLFLQTVQAVDAIVQLKLYKSKNSSLEQYFRTRWNISRAQVYRFMDCAAVLRDLSDFSVLPFRERLCRSLKTLAKTKQARQKLWSNVLKRVKRGSATQTRNAERLTSTLIEGVWREMCKSRDDVTSLVNDVWDKRKACNAIDSNPMPFPTTEEDDLSAENVTDAMYLPSPALSLVSARHSESATASDASSVGSDDPGACMMPLLLVPTFDDPALAHLIYNFKLFGDALRQDGLQRFGTRRKTASGTHSALGHFKNQVSYSSVDQHEVPPQQEQKRRVGQLSICLGYGPPDQPCYSQDDIVGACA